MKHYTQKQVGEIVSYMAQSQAMILDSIQKDLNKVMETAISFTITDIDTIPVTLEEIFLAYYGKGNGGNNA